MRAIAEPRYKERIVANRANLRDIEIDKIRSRNFISVLKRVKVGNDIFTFFADFSDVGIKGGDIENVVAKR